MEKINEKLSRKCVSLRNKCPELIVLERKEQLYMRESNYAELSRIKK